MFRALAKSQLLRGSVRFITPFSSFSSATGSKEHLDKLVKANKIVVFMKGNPDAPRCGFSNAVVQILKFHGVDNYDAHDVLQDEDLRQGDKNNSWVIKYAEILYGLFTLLHNLWDEGAVIFLLFKILQILLRLLLFFKFVNWVCLYVTLISHDFSYIYCT